MTNSIKNALAANKHPTATYLLGSAVDSIQGYLAEITPVIGDQFVCENCQTLSDGGGATWEYTGTTTGASAGFQSDGTFVAVSGATQYVLSNIEGVLTSGSYGMSPNSTDNSAAIGVWLGAITASGKTGMLEGEYLTDYVSKALTGSLKIRGSGKFIAAGANKLNLIHLTSCSDVVDLDGITIDGNNKVARPLEIVNTGATTSTLGEVILGERMTMVNAKNNSPDTYTVAAVRVHGGFSSVRFSGEIDGCDSTSTSGAAAIGLWTSWVGSTEDWVRDTIITSSSRIKNIKNDNTVLADADGMQITAPIGKYATLSVATGAYFENCKGRSIKSQVVANSIDSVVIRRDAYDGLIEIDLQYAGGYVASPQIIHDGVRVTSIVSIALRSVPAKSDTNVEGVRLQVITAPSTPTTSLVAIATTDDVVAVKNIRVSNNRCLGEVNYLVTVRVADVSDNFITIEHNHATTVAQDFIQVWRYGVGTPTLDGIFKGNSLENTKTTTVEELNTLFLPSTSESNRGMPEVSNEFRSYVGASLVNKSGDGTYYDIAFNTENYDYLSSYNTSTGVFTAPRTGRYKIAASVKVVGVVGSHTDLELQIRGAFSYYFADVDPSSLFSSGGFIVFNGETEMDLTAGDTATVRLTASGGTKVIGISSGQSSFFSAKFLA